MSENLQEQISILTRQLTIQNTKQQNLEQQLELSRINSLQQQEKIFNLTSQISSISISQPFGMESSILSDQQYQKLENGLRTALNQILVFKELINLKDQQISNLSSKNNLKPIFNSISNFQLNIPIKQINNTSDSQNQLQFQLFQLLQLMQILQQKRFIQHQFILQLETLNDIDPQTPFLFFLIDSIVQLSQIFQLNSRYNSLLNNFFSDTTDTKSQIIEFYELETNKNLTSEVEIFKFISEIFAKNHTEFDLTYYKIYQKSLQIAEKTLNLTDFHSEIQLKFHAENRFLDAKFSQIVSQNCVLQPDEFNQIQYLREEVNRLKQKLKMGQNEALGVELGEENLQNLLKISKIEYQKQAVFDVKVPKIGDNFFEFLILRGEFEL